MLSVATGPAQRNVKSCTPVELRVNTEMTPVLAGRYCKQDNNPLKILYGKLKCPSEKSIHDCDQQSHTAAANHAG
jgi:hypothetical protein